MILQCMGWISTKHLQDNISNTRSDRNESNGTTTRGRNKNQGHILREEYKNPLKKSKSQ